MNSFIKNNKQFFSLLLGLLLSSSLHAITINNQPLGTIGQLGEVISTTVPENSYIILEMEKDNLNVSHANIDGIENLKEAFQEVTENSFCSFNSKGPFDMSVNALNRNWDHMIGEKCLNFQIKTSLTLVKCLFESPFISITGNEMNFDDCFLINPQVLNIIGDCPESDYKVIQVIFYDQPENPTIIDGKMALKDNEMKKRLIISNVKKIRIQFNPQVWNN